MSKEDVIQDQVSKVEVPENRSPSPSPEVALTEFKLHTREKVVFTLLMILSFFAALESTGIGVALPNMALDLGSTTTSAFWIGTSYLLVSAVSQPAFASFSHVFGRRPVIIFALLLFDVGTIVCALSKNTTTILAGRTIQGLGSGGCLSIIEILITDIVPLHIRGEFFGLISLSWALGAALGPVIAGAVVEYSTWRWIFWILLPFSGLTSLFLPPTLRLKPKTQSLLKKINSIDWVGCFLLVASSISFLIAVSWGGIQFEWSAPQTLVPLFLGAAGISAFVIWEQLGTSQPVLPIRIFCNRTSATVLWHSMVTGLTIWSGLYYLPVYFQGVKGYSPLGSAVALFPLTLTLPPFAVLFGILIKKTGQYRKFLWLGWLLATLGAGLFILLDLDTSRAQWTFNTMFAGIGLGILLPVLRVAVQASSSNEDMAFAASLVMTTRVLGMSLAIGVCGIIFQNVFRLKVQGPAFSNRADALSKDALGVVNLIQQLSDADPDKVVLRRALGDSIRFVWVFLAAMSGFSLFTSFFTRELSLHRNLETDQGVEHGAAFEMAIEPKLTADWIVTECRLAAIASKEANNEQKEFDC